MSKNEDIKIDNLVICSTLNQLVNYLLIKKYKPKRIINITLDSEVNTKQSIHNKDWDIYLRDEVKRIKEYKYECESIFLRCKDMLDVAKIENAIKKGIDKRVNNEEKIYWNITGGQRTISLAINNYIKNNNRINDRMIYIEGNSEHGLIISENSKNNDMIKYGDEELTLDTAMRLVGIDEVRGNINKEKQQEYSTFLKLYNIIIDDIKEDDNLRKELIKSNKENTPDGRSKVLEDVFDELCKAGRISKDDREIIKIYEGKGSYPCGTIFEKIATAKINECIDKKKKNFVDFSANYKVKYNNNNEKPKGIIDEIDIALLTAIGQLTFFECKSGGMSGDNAKSHKYTTYRLAGVFGNPIFLTLLTQDELDVENNDDYKKNLFQAYGAAQRAELETWAIDKIEEKFEEVFGED